jgi:mRNA interferase RelE/StbE
LPTIYKVEFRPKAFKAFGKIGTALQRQLAKKLEERRRKPHVPADKLHDMPGCYKIKMRSSGLRAVYQVKDDRLILLVLAVAGRDKDEAYQLASAELKTLDD